MPLPYVLANGDYADADKLNANFDYLDGLATNIDDSQIASDAAIDPTKVATSLANTNLQEDIQDLDSRITAVETSPEASAITLAKLHAPLVTNLSVSIDASQATIGAGTLILEGREHDLAVDGAPWTFALQDGKVYAIKADHGGTDRALRVWAEDISGSSVEYLLSPVVAVDSTAKEITVGSAALNLLGAHAVCIGGVMNGQEFTVAWVDGTKVYPSMPLGSAYADPSGGGMILFRLENGSRDAGSTASVAVLAHVGFVSAALGGAVLLNDSNGGQGVGLDKSYETDWTGEIAVGSYTWVTLSLDSKRGTPKDVTALVAYRGDNTGTKWYSLQQIKSTNTNVSSTFKGVAVVPCGANVRIGISDSFRTLFAADKASATATDYAVEAIRVKINAEYR